VISQQLVRRLFPSDDPIGKPLRVAGAQVEVIGVVGDVAIGPRAAPRGYVYHSHTQFAADRNWALTQVVALDRRARPPLGEIRRELAAIDPALVLYEPRMLDDVIGGSVAQERFALLLVAAFAILALVLAGVGVYGVLSYSVTRRALRQLDSRTHRNESRPASVDQGVSDRVTAERFLSRSLPDRSSPRPASSASSRSAPRATRSARLNRQTR
jgi:hypothetical protein